MDVTLDQAGQVVAARDIAKGEIISIPLEIYERIGKPVPRAPTQAEIDAAKPGDVLPDGTIMTAPAGGHPGFPVGRGTVGVTPDQAAAAAPYGWISAGPTAPGAEIVWIVR